MGHWTRQGGSLGIDIFFVIFALSAAQGDVRLQHATIRIHSTKLLIRMAVSERTRVSIRAFSR